LEMGGQVVLLYKLQKYVPIGSVGLVAIG
jgi:hypothetical protein